MYQKKSADDQPQSISEISSQLTMVIDQVKNFGEDVKKKWRQEKPFRWN